MAAGTIAPPDLDQTATPTMPPIQGAPAPAAPAAPAQPAAPAAAPQATPAAPAPAPPGAQPNAIANQPQKGVIDTGPQAEFDPKKLAKVKTTLDLVNAMKPASRTDYMDWWEKQHGDIDDRYDQLKQQLGQRPSDDEDYTKKEKFAALLEFGLHLMKNTAASVGSSNQAAPLANALSDTTEDVQQKHQAGIAASQSAYDTQANAIEDARQAELKGIGTPAAAMKQQSDMNRQDSENLKDTASAYKDVSGTLDEAEKHPEPATYSTGKDGSLYSIGHDANGNPVAKPVLGIDGKPYQGAVLGRATGSGVGQKDTAQIRNYKYLTGVLGVDENTANTIAFKPKTGNPMADHTTIYKSIMAATMGDEDKAKTGADQYIIDNYGPGALSKATTPMIPPQKPGGGPVGSPPPQALQGLKPGMIRDFGANGKWSVDIDGNPVRVGASAPLQ
jgi:hypothetical protein